MGQVLDALRARLLVLTGGPATLTTPDLYYRYLSSLGFTGTLADMKAAYAAMIGRPLTTLNQYIAAGGGGFNGPNLILNGTFDTDINGWASGDTGTGVSVWDGVGQLSTIGADSTANRGLRGQSFSAQVGRIYQVTFAATVNSGAGAIMVGGSLGSTTVMSQSVTGVSARSYQFTAANATTFLSMRNGVSGGDLLWDNVVVRALT